MLDGRRATLERIYIDFDDRVHLAVTVDDDPGQDLMRETGRYLFFFPHEVQPAMSETDTVTEPSRSSSPGSATRGCAMTGSEAR